MDEEWVVSADWLADRLDDVRVVDVRDAWEYEGIGHIPGAVSLPFEEFRSESGDEGMLPGEDRWAELVGGLGISPDDTIIAYDDMHGVFAARFVVTAMVYGHADVRLLDGDYSAWLQAHHTTTDVPEVQPVTYEVRDVETPLVDADAVADAIDDPDAVLVDTRSPEEYADGHIEGAVNLDWREVVDDETRGLRPREAVEELLEDRGITADKRVVLYCNTARRISHTYVVLQWLGFPNVEFYEGSLTEWEAEGRPVTTT